MTDRTEYDAQQHKESKKRRLKRKLRATETLAGYLTQDVIRLERENWQLRSLARFAKMTHHYPRGRAGKWVTITVEARWLDRLQKALEQFDHEGHPTLAHPRHIQ